MKSVRTYKSKSGAEYELVQTKAPTPKRSKSTKKSKSPAAAKKKKPTQKEHIDKMLSLNPTEHRKFNEAFQRGATSAVALTIATKKRRKPSSIKRARKSAQKRAGAKKPSRKKSKQLSMF